MGNIKLVIKYQDKYFCEKVNNRITFIRIPTYNPKITDFGNLLTFIKIFLTGYLNENYGSNIALSNAEWLQIEYNLIAITGSECLYEVDKDTYFYDINKISQGYLKTIDDILSSVQKGLPNKLVCKTEEELLTTVENSKNQNQSFAGFNELNVFNSVEEVSPNLLNVIKKEKVTRTDKDVLLMYSGGKDSTLAAIRLRQLGFNVYFVHFDNGYERDSDKPLLTYKEIFGNQDGYTFDYKYASVNVSDNFHKLFHEQIKNQTIVDKKLKSEVCCLSCRTAMYIKAIQIAKKEGIKYIADGARISQKFMLEQISMIKKYQDLCLKSDIRLFCPVLTVQNDEDIISELLINGYSAKTWESKCLIGKPAIDKTTQDEEDIMKYYEEIIEPTAQRLVFK